MAYAPIVTSKILWQKPDSHAHLHILSAESVVSLLKERPPGSAILRLDEELANTQKKSPLIVSYKLKTHVIHHHFQKLMFRVQQGKNGFVCKTEKRMYKCIQTLSDFFPALRRFIIEFASNSNFVESEMEDDPAELENELYYRKFVIYPQREFIVIKTKEKSASVGIDWRGYSFFAEQHNEEGGSINAIKSFNEFLLEFLCIPTDDKLKVKAALGYQNNVDLYTGEVLGRTEAQRDVPSSINIQQEGELAERYRELTPIVRSRDKKLVLDRLKELYDEVKPAQWKTEVPQEVLLILRAILESVKILPAAQINEKTDWVSRGLITLLLSIIERNGNNDAYNDMPIQICKHLMENNPEGNAILIPLCFTQIERDFECVGIYRLFATLVHVEAFRGPFVRNLALPKLVNSFLKASTMLFGENSIGKVDHGPVEASPRPEQEDEEEEIKEEEQEKKTELSTSAESKPPSTPTGKKPRVPIPLLPLVIPGLASPRASTYRIDHSTKTEDFRTLAQKLGETYMTADLTGLLGYLEGDMVNTKHRSRRISVKTNSALVHLPEDDQFNITSYVIAFRNSSYYKVKCAILQTITGLTVYREFMEYIRVPVNLLFVELVGLMSQLKGSGGITRGAVATGGLYDEHYWGVIYGALSNFAEYVEYCHRFKWSELTMALTYPEKINFRKKLDRFIWRLHQRLIPAIESMNFIDMEIQLAILADYMHNCPTRTMSAHVVEVCMESIIQVMDIAFSKGRATVLGHANVRLINSLFEVIDELIEQNKHPAFDELLVQILFTRVDSYSFMCSYVGRLLSDSTVEKQIVGSSGRGKGLLKLYRARGIKHFGALLDLLQRQVKYLKAEKAADILLQPLIEHLTEMSFLTQPNNGFIMKYIGDKVSRTTISLKREMLLFLYKVFSFPDCPFIKDKTYVDSYLSSHWIQFVKMYHSFDTTETSIELCELHLKILLAFAAQKNEDVKMKFYQLRVMNFLVREVSLEYEVTLVTPTKESKPAAPVPAVTKTEAKGGAVAPTTNGPSTALAPACPPGPINLKLALPPNIGGGMGGLGGMGITIPADPPAQPPQPAVPVLLDNANQPFSLKLPPIPGISSPSLLESKKSASSSSRSEVSSPNSPDGEDRDSSRSSSSRSRSGSDSSRSDTDSEKKDRSSSRASTDSEDENEKESGSEKSDNSDQEKGSGSDREGDSGDENKGSGSGSSSEGSNKNSEKSERGGGDTTDESSVSSEESEEEPQKVIPQIKAIPKLTITLDMTKGFQPEKQVQIVEPEEDKDEKDKEKAGEKKGALSNLESRIKANTKLHLLLAESAPDLTESLSENSSTTEEATKSNLAEQTRLYKMERLERKLYHNESLHVTFLELIFSLMLTPNGTLEHLYNDQFPLNSKKLNIPFLLHHHINHPANRNMLPRLSERTRAMGPAEFRLMKLICKRLFDSSQYKDMKKLGVGAYGTVYKCSLEHQHLEVAVKLMEVPKSIHSRCVLHDIFTEISILDSFRHDSRISHLYDYGVDGDYYWIVMKKYSTSLKEWRKRQTAPLSQNLSLYLSIFMHILNIMQFCQENKVNHFDIKCDNFLLMPLAATGIEEDDKHLEETFWNQPNDTPNFSICLADFGESKVYETEEEGYTLRNRGTEFNKSPEMLNVAYLSQKTKETYDRNKKVGANSATDVWALGCLFFELLTGEFLFYDADSSWVRFFLRITSASGEQLITPEKKQLIDSNQHVIDLLHYIFVRDPLYRPSIGYVIQRLKHVRRQVVQRSTVPSVFYPAQRPRLAMKTEEKEKTEEEENKAAEKDPMEGPKPSEPLFRKDDTVEAKYFNENCTMVLPNLFIGPLNTAKNKVMMKKLDITHFVNLSSDFRFDQWYFDTLCIPAGHITPESILSLSRKMLEFIKSANDGKVLVFCDDGCSLSGAFVVTYLMNTQGWSYFDSYTFLRDRLYRLNIPTEIQRELASWDWNQRRQPLASSNSFYECICGAASFCVKDRFDQPIRSCKCAGNNPACPNANCFTTLQDLYKNFGYKTDAISWGITTLDNIASSSSEWSTREAAIYETFEPKEKHWKLYRCRSCDYITHALAVDGPLGPSTTIAIVTNIAVTRPILPGTASTSASS